MRHLASIALMLATTSVGLSQANAQETQVFKASSAWALDYGDDYCRLMLDLESGDDTVGLFIERTQPGPMMRMIVIGDAVKLYRRADQVGFKMYPAGASRSAPILRYETAGGQQYLNLGPMTFANLPPPAPGAPPTMPPPYSRDAEAAAANEITGVSLESGLTAPILLETGALGNAAQALQTCADDLVASWGLDAEAHKSLSRGAMPAQPTAGWLRADTVPFTEFAKLSGGNNELRLMVNAQGEATACHVHWPTLDSDTNEKICELVIENAAMMPALDAGGRPIDSFWMTSLFFLFPPFGG